LSIVIQAWFFVTPVFYPITVLPESAQILGMTVDIQLWVRRLNPMASLIASYRDVLYRGNFTGLDFFLRTFVTCLVALLVGYYIFGRFSPLFGEEV
jgi:ABC-type polysaccharide/polyol phosphate export permease